METETIEILNVPFVIPNCEYEYKSIDCINVIDFNHISYSTFFEEYMQKNCPCIIKNISNNWLCTKKWIKDDKIDTYHMCQLYGDLNVSAALCSEYNIQTKISMKFSEYVAYFENPSGKLLYLKDWHLWRSNKSYEFYSVPSIFSSDWLNEYAEDNKEDDFMFVYMGPEQTWTPLHVDVYNSFSWSVNVIGRKKWLLFPPGEELKLMDRFGNLPLLFEAQFYENVKYFETIQERGAAIFVPSGWYHQVINLMDTISVNHNWVNGCNIRFTWNALMEALKAVENEINDLKDSDDYNTQCQIILKSNFGMNCENFALLIKHIGTKRLRELQSMCGLLFGKYKQGINHTKFDLKNILLCINNMSHHHEFFTKYVNNENLEKDLHSLETKILNEIEKVL